MDERLTDNEFHSKDNKERACYIQEPRLQAIYDKCFEYEDIDTNPTRLANIKKTLEIIKNKNVDIRGIKETKNVHEYNVKFPTTLNEFLEKQEYELVLGVLYE